MVPDLRGIALGFLLLDLKKEKAFHMIYHEAEWKKTAFTDLYRMILEGLCPSVSIRSSCAVTERNRPFVTFSLVFI